VNPPTATFILQLFLIPLLIVSLVVLLWLLFSWVAHLGRDDARKLVEAIDRGDPASWQRAFELADLLRSTDPRYEPLRRDAALAGSLARLLERDLAEPLARDDAAQAPDKPDGAAASAGVPDRALQARLMRRMYLCRALGSFTVSDGLSALLKAARQQRRPEEVEVRFAALEAIATLADRCEDAAVSGPEVLAVLLEASRASDPGQGLPPRDDRPGLGYLPQAELRAVAAYALGVVGGPEALARLAQMLHDPYPNARYNAATGLARHGDPRCIPVLKEMLDPANEVALRDESNPNDQARKRTTVLLNGIKASVQLAQAQPQADLSDLEQAIDRLVRSPLREVVFERQRVKDTAQEALRQWPRRAHLDAP
jgi:hypothetical protein